MSKKIVRWSMLIVGIVIISTFFIANLYTNIVNDFNLNLIYNPLKILNVLIENKSLLWGLFLVIVIIILFIMRYDFNINNKVKNSEDVPDKSGSNEYGSARWAKDKEIKKFKIWSIGDKLKRGGIVVTYKKDKFYYDDSSNHTLVIGSTGSGKTVSTIMPLIFNLADASESMIINDSKGELLRKTNDYLIKKGYKIKVINLRAPSNSNYWNPLYLPYKYYKESNIEKAVELINDFSYSLCQEVSARDPYWSESSSSVLSGLCLALIQDAKNKDEVHFNSIYNLLIEHGTKTLITKKNSLDDYFDSKELGNLAKNYYATGGFAKGETRATIFSVLSSKLRIFNDVGIASMTSNTDFELENIGKEKTAVFLVIPDEKESRHILGSLFVDQAYQSLVKVAQEQVDGKLPYRVNFVLDEFANMPPIKSFSNKITVSRSRHIRFYLIIQDFDQLKEKYKEQTGTIKSNCNNWIYLLTADNDTAKEISNRLGKYTITSSRISTSTRLNKIDLNVSNDKSLIGRELLTPDELMKFKLGEGIFLQTRLNPIKSKFLQIDDYPITIIEKEYNVRQKINKVKLFNLDKYREKQNAEIFKVENEQLDIVYDPTLKPNMKGE
ncbi:MAG: type IV secretory system conjugative DNA transfer family protein [Clostridia bacterium]|nr:type IV secretory system conjugative DNA transfer family protein [Clostridia bacterium]